MGLALGIGLAVAGVLILVVRARLDQRLQQLRQASAALADRLQQQIHALAASRSQIEGILQEMTEGVLAIGAAGEIVLINPAARQIFDLGPHVQTGRPLSDAVRSPEIQAIVQDVQRTGGAVSRDLTVYAPVERELRVHATTYASSPSGVGVLLVLHDITEFRRLEHLRREFVANVSHELKTPLTVIQGAVETLLDGALDDPTHRHGFVASIAEEATRLRRLVDDLLTLAQVESRQAMLKRESLPLRPFVEAEIARHQALAAAHQVALALDVSETLPPVWIDRGQLAHAVGNLLDNAIKYNRPGGRVVVRATVEQGHLRLEVEDTGIGIPTADLPRVFERFYRVDKARSRETGGTGLGLSIVKHVAEAHGGSVQVESTPQHGSRFTLSLPLL